MEAVLGNWTPPSIRLPILDTLGIWGLSCFSSSTEMCFALVPVWIDMVRLASLSLGCNDEWGLLLFPPNSFLTQIYSYFKKWWVEKAVHANTCWIKCRPRIKSNWLYSMGVEALCENPSFWSQSKECTYFVN